MHIQNVAACLVLAAAAAPAQTLTRELVASGLPGAVFATAPAGDYERVFVVQQGGTIRIVENGTLLPTPFLTQAVATGSERGLLGLAFHPDYASNGHFYVDYTRPGDGATMVVRYTVSANPDVADPTTARTMIGPITQPFSNHNAGWIAFGPDGYLYVANGDGGARDDPACNAQNGQSLLGKILRLDVDANPSGPAIAPTSNPFVGNPAFRDEIWAYGLRNPWRCSFDRETGDLWIGDVGQDTLEEIDFQPATSTGGENYGWKLKEGTNCYLTTNCINPLPCSSPLLVDPVRTLPTSTNCAVIGGYVYRGCAIPTLRGTYVHGDNCSGRIWSFRLVNGAITDLVDRTAQLGAGGGLTSFGEDASGEILICVGSSVYRVAPTGSITNSVAGPGSVGSNGLVPVYEACGSFGAGNFVTFRLRSAPASAPAAVLFGRSSNPTTLPFPGFGDLVPVPVAFSIPVVVDADGIGSFTIPSGGAALSLFHQCAIADLALGGVTLSNALSTFFNAGPPPTISSVSPLSAAPGATVTVSGTEFSPSATLTVGSTAVAPSTITPTRITFPYPAGIPCDSTVAVANHDGQSASRPFNPTPAVTNPLSPQGSAAGGLQFIMVGSGFAPGTTVTIGGAPATVNSATANVLIVTTPPGTPGPATVSITTPGGCSTTTTYTYL